MPPLRQVAPSPPTAAAPPAPSAVPAQAVLWVVAGLVAVSGLCLLAVGGSPVLVPEAELPWWLLLVLGVAAALIVLEVPVSRETRLVTLSDVPLVLGLFLAAPTTVVAVQVAAAVLAMAVRRRASGLKLLVNLACALVEASVAVAVFRLLAAGAEPVGGRSWVAVYVALLVANAVSVSAVTTVIGLCSDGVRRADLRRAVLGSGVPLALVTGTAGLLAVTSLVLDRRTAWLLVPAGALAVAAFRAYAGLVERHRALERFHASSEAVRGAHEVEDVIRSVLAQARDLTGAGSADLVLLPAPDPAAPGLRMSYDGTLLRRDESREAAAGSWLRSQVQTGPAAVLVGPTLGEAREWLAERGVREALVAPLRGAAGVVGAVVLTGRQGTAGFVPSHLPLLERVTQQAGIALEHGRLLERLRHEARHDPLTGLANRVRLEAGLVEQLARTAAGSADGFALLLLDLDRFKVVNDTLGHHSGDALLRQLGERLLRTVPTGALVARLGGDEFAVLLPDVVDPDVAEQTAESLLEAVSRPVSIEDVQLRVGGSIGVALAPADGAEVGRLLRSADVAMYVAKAAGGGVRAYAPELDHDRPRMLVLGAELRGAFRRGELEVHAQPQARLATGEVDRVELLLRWRHPHRGLVLPEEFLPVAERTGLLRSLTGLVLGRGMAAWAGWQAAGLDLGLSVNLSTVSLLDPDLVSDVVARLRHHGMPPGSLTLEVAEGSVLSDLTGASAVLQQLHDAGVRLSLDDFGAGLSSLSSISRLPVQEVKIDRSLIAGVRGDGQDAAMTRSVVDLGASLGLQVVAEGVEDAETWHWLRRLGCHRAQGWVLSPALPLAEVEPWARRRGRRPGP